MFNSHLGDGSLLGDLGADETTSDWRTTAVEKGADILKNLTGTNTTPAPTPKAAKLPTTATNPVALATGISPLPVGMPPAPTTGRNNMKMFLLVGGIAVASVVGFMAMQGKPKARRRIYRRKTYRRRW